MRFPIFKIDKNQITSMDGEHSLFYEIRAKDYETMTSDSFDICGELLANKLNQIGEEEWFSFNSRKVAHTNGPKVAHLMLINSYT